MSTAKEQVPSAKTEPELLSTAEAPTVQLEGIHYRTGLPVRVSCSQGRIVSVEPLPAGRNRGAGPAHGRFPQGFREPAAHRPGLRRSAAERLSRPRL
ncbi:hypothetical protein ACHHV8_04050 [Paenibacillus sp. TAB 01]|uniref:hypothetical protein n=1 Tax=Paenibacillus sp. TAB 01 TaxID=3368988 RepID=UPI0037500162